MPDVFGATPTFAGAFAMDEALLTFSTTGGDGGLGSLVQNVSVQYTRPVQRIYELGPRRTTYYVTGRPEGRMAISRLAAPEPVNNTFLAQYADPCNVPDNNMVITVRPGTQCEGTVNGVRVKPGRYKFTYCLIDSLSFQIATQVIALTENISLIFAGMELDTVS